MATKNITISKVSLLKAYREAGPALKEFMKQLFGPDTFAISFNVMDRIKTFQDAVAELGNDNPLVQQYNQFYTEFGDMMDQDIIAYLKLRSTRDGSLSSQRLNTDTIKRNPLSPTVRTNHIN